MISCTQSRPTGACRAHVGMQGGMKASGSGRRAGISRRRRIGRNLVVYHRTRLPTHAHSLSPHCGCGWGLAMPPLDGGPGSPGLCGFSSTSWADSASASGLDRGLIAPYKMRDPARSNTAGSQDVHRQCQSERTWQEIRRRQDAGRIATAFSYARTRTVTPRPWHPIAPTIPLPCGRRTASSSSGCAGRRLCLPSRY